MPPSDFKLRLTFAVVFRLADAERLQEVVDKVNLCGGEVLFVKKSAGYLFITSEDPAQKRISEVKNG